MGGPCDCDGETHSELDNFHNCRFKVQVAWLQLSGEWPSAEAAFQAAKFPEDPAAQEAIRKSSGGMDSFKQGQESKLRSDWEEIKVNVMYEVNKAKFLQNPAMKAVLLRGHGPITARGGLFWKTWNEVWAANKRFEISKFKFKFPRARTYELIRARSRLYRSQILQDLVNTRWKALAEIYTMHSFAPFSTVKFLFESASSTACARKKRGKNC